MAISMIFIIEVFVGYWYCGVEHTYIMHMHFTF